jgi:hypothetical protein
MAKAAVNKKKSRKMDRYTVSSQTWELDTIRRMFYKMEGERIDHPSRADIMSIKKQYGKSRVVIYRVLAERGYKKD